MINGKSLAEKIIEKDPNGLLVVDEELNIVQFNGSFLKMFEIIPTSKIVGMNINEVLEQEIFIDADIVKDCGAIKHHRKTGKFVKAITFTLEDENLSACFFVNVTDSFHSKRKMQLLKTETVNKAQQVINNQMRVAQEIASLLGETTAESKSTLLQLMDILKEEGEI